MFFCKYCEIFKNNFVYRTPLVAISIDVIKTFDEVNTCIEDLK